MEMKDINLAKCQIYSTRNVRNVKKKENEDIVLTKKRNFCSILVYQNSRIQGMRTNKRKCLIRLIQKNQDCMKR